MGGRDVMARTGERWHVRPVWAPRLWDDTVGSRMRRRWRRQQGRLDRHRKRLDGIDAADGWRLTELADFDDGVGLIVAGIVGAVLAALIVLFVLVFALPLLIEVALLVAVTVLGVAGKVLLRRPWTIAAESDDGTRMTWRVVGWRASRAHVDAVADALEHGYAPPRGGTTLSASGRSPAGGGATMSGSA